jgi:hypothetical protein
MHDAIVFFLRGLKPVDRVSFSFARAIEMADEFEWVEVTGVDLAPVQPR